MNDLETVRVKHPVTGMENPFSSKEEELEVRRKFNRSMFGIAAGLFAVAAASAIYGFKYAGNVAAKTLSVSLAAAATFMGMGSVTMITVGNAVKPYYKVEEEARQKRKELAHTQPIKEVSSLESPLKSWQSEVSQSSASQLNVRSK